MIVGPFGKGWSPKPAGVRGATKTCAMIRKRTRKSPKKKTRKSPKKRSRERKKNELRGKNFSFVLCRNRQAVLRFHSLRSLERDPK